MKKRYALPLISSLLLSFAGVGQTQQPAAPSLAPVVVDVFVTNKSTKAPAEGLTQEDFQLTDNHHAVAVSSFAQAQDGSARPLSVWLVLMCPETGMSQTAYWNGSDFMRGHAAQLTLVLHKLSARDTVGVAHWCDDSSAAIDLNPTLDRDAPAAAIEALMAKHVTPIDSYYGEESRLRAVRLVRETAQKFNPGATVVLIFLAGDEVLLEPDRAADMLGPSPDPPTIFFVVNNGAVLAAGVTPKLSGRRSLASDEKVTANLYQPVQPLLFLATKTGGDSFSSMRGEYGELLDRIVTQLQGRYQLTFTPKIVDEKPHNLEVKLTASGQAKVHSASLRARQEYLASVAMPAPSPEAVRDAALAEAIQSTKPLTEIPFDASGKNPGNGQTPQFRLFVDASSLSWIPLEGGDVHAELALAIAGISSQGSVLSNQIKGFEAHRSKADAANSPQPAVILSATFAVPQDAVTVRFVLRDGKSGRVGSFDLPVSRIKLAPAPTPAPVTPSTQK